MALEQALGAFEAIQLPQGGLGHPVQLPLQSLGPWGSGLPWMANGHREGPQVEQLHSLELALTQAGGTRQPVVVRLAPLEAAVDENGRHSQPRHPAALAGDSRS